MDINQLRHAMRVMGARGGRKAAQRMTAAQRKDRALKASRAAAKARQAKRGGSHGKS